MNLLKRLNPEQKKAVTYSDGPLLIIAGAGTGKTKVITTRIAYLIEKGLAKPNEILALTFTDKAAQEMEERVDLLLPIGVVETYISTFHSFADEILRQNAVLFGLDPDFKILKKSEQILFFRDNLYKFKLRELRPPTNPTKFIETILRIISRAKDENISAQEYLAWAKKTKNDKIQLEIAKTYQTYQELLQKHNYLDFGDLIFRLLSKLKKYPEVLYQLKTQFKYILVDEFQDTNYIQNELVKIIAAAGNNITVVADDDQSIYRFRGAAISNVLNFKKDYPQAKTIVLSKNYRSTQLILDTSYNFIQHNNPDRLEISNKINKRLIAQTKKRGRVEFLYFDSEASETNKIAEIIKKKVKNKSTQFKDIAILVRANSYAESFIKTLNLNDIPSQFSGDKNLYRRPEIQLLLNFLRLMTTNHDNLALYHLALSSIYNLDINDLIELNDFCRRKNCALYAVMSQIDENNLSISPESKEKVRMIIKDIKKYRELSKKRLPGEVLYQFLNDKDVIKELRLNSDTPENEIKIRNISFFFDHLNSFQRIVKAPTIMHLIEYIDTILDSGTAPEERERDPDINAVNVMTAHAAKGLEFKIVFISSLIDGRFPSTRRGENLDLPDKFIKEILPQGDWHIEEERRLFYVGMTRAKEELYLTCASMPSPFIAEALGKRVITETQKQTIKKIEQIELYREEKSHKIKKRFGDSLYLSYSQLDDYLTCPYKYENSSIIRVPVMQHFAAAFGSSLHRAVAQFYRAKINGKTMSFKNLYNNYLLNWQNDNYLNEEHEHDAKTKGKRMLLNFYKKERLNPPPAKVEQRFRFKVGRDTIAGFIDAVWEDNGEVRIIDFKSSNVDSKDKAYQAATSSLQLGIYALAHKELKGRLPDSVGLYFLGSGIVGESKPTERRIETVKRKIQEAREGIVAQKFDPKPSSFNCLYCAFSKICPYSEV
ncbi:ATP-dependent helicase [Patescibacteria group bacterium]|nr:ATP-dependent helicase [Patescibacteria group bacterium]